MTSASTPLEDVVGEKAGVGEDLTAGSDGGEIDGGAYQRYAVNARQRSSWRDSSRSVLVVVLVAILGLLLLLALVALMAIILLHSTGAKPNESLPTYFSRLISGAPTQCDVDPPIFPYLHWDWDGQSYQIGTVVRYQCGYVNETPVAKAMQCRMPGRWEMTYDNPRACRLDDAGFQSKADSERRLKTPSCSNSDPPNAGNYYRDWNRLRWSVGTTINYYCSKEPGSPLVKTVTCTTDLNWQVTMENTQETCECDRHPPNFDSKDRDLLVWDPDTRWVGTVIGIRCSDDMNSEYEYMYECSVKKEWVLKSSTTCPSTKKRKGGDAA